MLLATKGIIYTLIVFALLCFAFKKRDSVKLYNVIMFFCWVVIALSMESYDIANYRYIYDSHIAIGKDIFFDTLQSSFSSLGIPFAFFKVLFCTAIWAFLYAGFRKYTEDFALAAAFFLLGPVIGFGTQLRSSIAGVIILNALPFLLRKDRKAWMYCLLVILATCFHMMAAFYFVFLIPKLFRGDSVKFRNVLCVIALLLYPLFWFGAKPLADFIVWLQPSIRIGFINSLLTRVVPYLDGSLRSNLTGIMYNTLAHLILFLAVDRMCVIMERFRKDRQTGFLSDYALNYLHKLNSILLLIVPCYMLCMQFDRFHTYFVPVAYCLIAQGLRELHLAGGKAPITGFLDLAPVKKIKFLQSDKLRLLNGEKYGLLRPGIFEVALLLACMIFCFYVGNWHSPQGFLQIIDSIARFGGT